MISAFYIQESIRQEAAGLGIWGSMLATAAGRDPGDEVVIHEPMGMGRDKYSTRLQDCHVDLLETAKYLRLRCTVCFVLCKCFVSLAIG